MTNLDAGVVGAGPEFAEAAADRSRTATVRSILRIPEARVGASLLAVVLLLVVVGPVLAPYPPDQVGLAPAGTGPSSAHLLGTDALGRDVLSRLLTGGGSVLVVPLVATVLAFITGGVAGVVAGYSRGHIDLVLSRCVDVMLAIPGILLVLLIMTAFGTTTRVVVLAITFAYAPAVYRVMRGAAMSLGAREFVQAAQARGDSLRWIVGREILPNLGPTMSVEFALRMTWAVMFFASLSFLGLGVQPPSSNWGVMVNENRSVILSSPVAVIAPSVAIGLLAISINMIADAFSQHFSGSSSAEAIL